MDELDVYKAARLLLDTQGEQAVKHAQERIIDLTLQGSIVGQTMWLRVAAAIEDLCSRTLTGGQLIQ